MASKRFWQLHLRRG